MRVISGSRRGKKLFGFEGEAVRPTTDRVKENMFNIIAGYVRGAAVLDLFAGTGALAIEALSRGAESAVLCDSANASIALIRRNIQATGFEAAATVVKADAAAFLRNNTAQFDMIFLDPPYNTGLLKTALKQIAASGALAKGGIIVAERDDTEPAPAVQGLTLIRERKYGRTHIELWCAGEDDGNLP